MVLLGLLLSGFTLRLLLGAAHPLVLSPNPNLAKIQKVLVATGFVLLLGPWFLAIANAGMSRLGVRIQTPERAEKTRLLALSLLVPWFILLLLAEPGKPERFMWLFPMQALFLAALVTEVLPRLHVPRWIVWATGVLLVLLIARNYFFLSRVESWAQSGWAGSDAERIRVVDAVTEHIRTEGKDRASIGYQIYFYPFMAQYHITNPIYKVGAEFDLLFYYRSQITNANQCAEGLAPEDEFLVVQVQPEPMAGAPQNYFEFNLDDRFHLISETESYQVWKKD
jgi:hypothetical protein